MVAHLRCFFPPSEMLPLPSRDACYLSLHMHIPSIRWQLRQWLPFLLEYVLITTLDSFSERKETFNPKLMIKLIRISWSWILLDFQKETDFSISRKSCWSSWCHVHFPSQQLSPPHFMFSFMWFNHLEWPTIATDHLSVTFQAWWEV